MNPSLRGVWEHIRNLGLGALAHSNRHAAYAAMENDSWPNLSVIQAAHAAELLIKARIAQEHPLLIFDQLPRSSQADGERLDLEALLRSGRTVQWSELPERLWATTGQVIPARERYDSFGRLRNGLQHFGAPSGLDPGTETLRFTFEVVDPFINECWGLFAVDYDEDYEPYIYFVHALVAREIRFLVSPEAAATHKDWDVDWSKASPEYQNEMQSRVRAALEKAG